ncbi:potassium channel protein [Adhaeribacter arboris]|uniref:Potassium channel protein n=1 Tax=Adhaeribacter arboris TaxID=2072846 RepID=A0A2T2Y9Z2_9BACT|nr:potassium channel protein [Adhaeribacter arboris]PSR52258.1 potassium channel protein [Adhaeribacter arboris]
MNRFAQLKRLFIALALALLSLVVGTVGFMVIGQLNLRQAFYMTAITFSTTGFEEVKPLTPAGEIFTSFYILFNLFIFAYFLSVLSKYIFEGELQAIFKKYMSEKDLQKISNHVIVCGFGRNGSKACADLLANHEPVLVVEKDEQLLKTKSGFGEVTTTIVVGDATQDEVLKQAGIERAKAIITTLPKDADNVFVTLTARELNSSIQIIARASDKSTENKLYRAGANSVVMPDEIGGSHMANLVTRPVVIQFLEMLNGMGASKLVLEEIDFAEIRKQTEVVSIRELDIRNKTGVTVIGVKNNRNQIEISPSPDTQIGMEDVLILLGTEDQVKAFMRTFRKI